MPNQPVRIDHHRRRDRGGGGTRLRQDRQLRHRGKSQLVAIWFRGGHVLGFFFAHGHQLSYFAEIQTTTGGGAVFANDSDPVLTNCVFSGNRAWTSPNTPGTGGRPGVSATTAAPC